MYEYNINDIISEEDDLPSLQIHTKQFLGCFPNAAKIHNMTPSFPKMADIVGIYCKYIHNKTWGHYFDTTVFGLAVQINIENPWTGFQGVEIMAS